MIPALDSALIPPTNTEPQLVLADKGYVGKDLKKRASSRGYALLTPAKKNETRQNTEIETKLLKEAISSREFLREAL